MHFLDDSLFPENQEKLVITAAPYAPEWEPGDFPEDIPVTMDAHVQAAVDCYNAGATVLHIHVRELDGKGSKRLSKFNELLGRLREAVPEMILQVVVEPAVGLQAFQARELAFQLGLSIKQAQSAVSTIMNAYRAFRDCDATMLEINPLVVAKDDRVLALDAKMSFDDNALFRRHNVADMHDPSQQDPREAQAAEHNLNYIGLDGEIGCIVNGAGLAMATMDMIKHAGGTPANFLDVGGGASPERIATALKLVLSDAKVKAVLVNIFAGINRCDWVAKGVVQACQTVDVKVPLVVRLAGTNVEEGRKILADSGLELITAETLAEAAEKAVAACNAAQEPARARA